MSLHWTLRWLAMIVVFAVSTFAFAAYADASTGDRAPPSAEPSDRLILGESGDDSIDEPIEAADDDEDESTDTDDPPRLQRNNSPGFMLTITRSAFLGALLGAMLGSSFYIITRRQISAWNILYFGAGGVFFGATVGLIEVAVRESQPAPQRAEQRLDTFDDALHREMRQRTPDGPTIPLINLTF